MAGFDRELFEFLLPPIGKVEIVEFTGSQTGDRVHLRFIKPFRADWISEIVDHGLDDREAWFTDRGTSLPMGIRYWHHRHSVRRVSEDRSEIIDDIEYRFGNGLISLCMYPVMYLSFLPRKFMYKRYFSRTGPME